LNERILIYKNLPLFDHLQNSHKLGEKEMGKNDDFSQLTEALLDKSMTKEELLKSLVVLILQKPLLDTVAQKC